MARKRRAELAGRMAETERLAAVGRLAAGVAHEINNPLTNIQGLAELLLADGGLTAQQREDIQGIVREAQRCARIVHGLRRFSRAEAPAKVRLDLRELIEETLELLAYDLKRGDIRLEKRLEPAPALADPGQLRQVALQLLLNAREALEDAPKRRLRVASGTEGGRAFLRVADTGSGIAPDVLGRVFEPFFTTKPAGKGTGLGLSIAYGIVSEHGGEIVATGKPGAGAEFTVFLPSA